MTPWGGMALGVFAANPTRNAPARVEAFDLPLLTSDAVFDLLQRPLAPGDGRHIGRSVYAQEGSGFGLLERKASELARIGPAEPGATRGVPSAGALSEQMEELDEFVHHLLQIRDWLRQDLHLLPVVDDVIGRLVRELERRQAKQNASLAIVITVGGAFPG